MKKSLRNLVLGGLATLGSLGLNSCYETEIPEPIQEEPKTEEPTKEERYINLDGEVVNYVDFDYNVEMKNVDEANLELYHEGSQNSNTRISNSSISGAYENLLKGNYTLRATSDSLEAKKSFTIPDYEMTANLDGLVNSVNHDSEINWNLEGNFEDKNIEDTVKIESVNSNDFDVSVEGYNVNLKPKEGIVGNKETKTSSLELRLKSGNEEITRNLDINIVGPQNRNYSGTLEDNITNSGTKGLINFYSGEISEANYLGQIETDASGNFNVQVDESVQGEVIAEAIQYGNASRDFARVVELSENSENVIRAHRMSQELYNEGVSKEEFRNFTEEVNGDWGVTKWDLDNQYENVTGGFKGVLIYETSPNGSFTQTEQNELETVLRSNIGCYTGGKISGNELVVEKNYDGSSHSGEHGWIHVKKDGTLWENGLTGVSSDEGENYSSTIRLRNFHNSVTNHEYGHSLIAPRGHPDSIQKPTTIMTQYLGDSVGPADCELGYVLYDENTKPGEKWDKVLGDFHNFYTSTPKVKSD